MGFTVEHECPQCGAKVQLDEADHILTCPYCDVKSLILVSDYYRFVLPHKTVNKDIIYAPYLRFKGTVYYCKDMEIGYRIIDITRVGLRIRGLPISLGLRPQAMNMKFVTPDVKGSFLKFTLKSTELIEKAGKFFPNAQSEEIFHHTYIGETVSIIYLPLYMEGNRLFDAILQRPIAKFSKDSQLFTHIKREVGWKLTFVPTLCPQCGWDMKADKDSIVLICKNCDTAWEISKGKFIRIRILTVQNQAHKSIYLPFWRISVVANGVEINSFADFIRFTNQPKALAEEWEQQEMAFWEPAFKIRPKIFLNLSKRLTLSQCSLRVEDMIPEKNIYPVTLPWIEAVQGIKLTLASSTLNKKRVLPLLSSIRFEVKRVTLIYLPFMDTGHEMIQQQMCLSINKKAMEFGRSL